MSQYVHKLSVKFLSNKCKFLSDNLLFNFNPSYQSANQAINYHVQIYQHLILQACFSIEPFRCSLQVFPRCPSILAWPSLLQGQKFFSVYRLYIHVHMLYTLYMLYI